MNRKPSKTLIVDISNILFRVAAVQKHSPYSKDITAEDLVGLCMHISLQSILKWYNKFKPDFVVFAFEGGNNWRKAYTAKHQSRLAYKGNRVIDPDMKHFYTLMSSFYETIHSHTSICCLKIDGMEADDEIAGYCQMYAAPDHEIIIVSGDKDFIQLLKLPGVKLIDPDTGKYRNQPNDKAYEADLDYWLFLKCVRGDMGDYVPSAFPRVRSTRIKKAYESDYDKVNFMNETWIDESQKTHRVGDLFQENVKLLSLFDQPEDVRKTLEEGIAEQVENINTYSHFHFLRFLNDYDLKRVRDDAMKFVEMMASNQRYRKGEKSVKTLNKSEQVELQEEIQAATPKTNSLMEF